MFLYSFMPAVGLFAYMPQIRVVYASSGPLTDLSLHTWGVWLATSSIGLGYGVVCLKDFLFSATCGMNVACIAVIIGMVLYKRQRYLCSAKIGLVDVA